MIWNLVHVYICPYISCNTERQGEKKTRCLFFKGYENKIKKIFNLLTCSLTPHLGRCHSRISGQGHREHGRRDEAGCWCCCRRTPRTAVKGPPGSSLLPTSREGKRRSKRPWHERMRAKHASVWKDGVAKEEGHAGAPGPSSDCMQVRRERDACVWRGGRKVSHTASQTQSLGGHNIVRVDTTGTFEVWVSAYTF